MHEVARFERTTQMVLIIQLGLFGSVLHTGVPAPHASEKAVL